MTYRLRLQYPEFEITQDLTRLDELAERVAVEQLMHELNPVDPAGYVVMFAVHALCGEAVATGHFYVRPSQVTPPWIVPTRRTAE